MRKSFPFAIMFGFQVVSSIAVCHPVSQSPLPEIVTADPEWDWLKLDSGEWLKGEIRGLERDNLEFDSDELGILTLDWEDVIGVYSHLPMAVLIRNRSAVIVGRIRTENGAVVIEGYDRPVSSNSIIGLAVGVPKEINLWHGDVSVGLGFRSGNIEEQDIDISSRFVRRTARSSVRLSYTANYSEVENIESANDHRAYATYDYRLNKDWFLRPFMGEYFRDRFQNIDARWTTGLGAGYYLKDTDDLTWTIVMGPGYERVEYLDVPVEDDDSVSSAIFLIRSEYDQELTSDLDFYWIYDFSLSDKPAGSSSHHAMFAFDIDLFSDIDLRISLDIDYIDEPQQDASGNVPQKTDSRLTFGLSYDL